MGYYIFKYCTNLSEAEFTRLGELNIKDATNKAAKQSKYSISKNQPLLGTFGCGCSVTSHIFIVKANNYKECAELIRNCKYTSECTAWQRNTFGEIFDTDRLTKNVIMPNGMHCIVTQNSKGLYDTAVYYKVTQEFKDSPYNSILYDTIKWMENCYGANGYTPQNFEAQYRENRVY